MNNQTTIFAIIAIVAVLSVAVTASAMMSTAMAKDQFSKTGNPHDRPGNSDSKGNPHGPGNSPGSSGNPHFCPDDRC